MQLWQTTSALFGGCGMGRRDLLHLCPFLLSPSSYFPLLGKRKKQTKTWITQLNLKDVYSKIDVALRENIIHVYITAL